MQVIGVIIGIVIAIAFGWAIIFCLFALLTYAVLAIYAGLKFLCANGFIGLDALFYPGFDVPSVVVWAFWGLVGGMAIQGSREMQIYGRKGVGVLIALTPILLWGLIGVINNINATVGPNTKREDTKGTKAAQSQIKQDPVKPSTPSSDPPGRDIDGSESRRTEHRPVVDSRTPDRTAQVSPTHPREPRQVTQQQAPKTTPRQTEKPPKPPIPSGMVLIPAGEFQMGSDNNTDESPIYTVYIDAFYMDKYEVTNAEYKRFLDANPQWRKNRIPTVYHDGDYLKHWNENNYLTGKGDHPVTYVSWYAAMAYTKWAGKRLPTEAEWEKAARGGLVGQKYPWGDYINSTKANYNKRVGDTTSVGRYPSNAYGLHDMAGNVLEWCLDTYIEDFYVNASRQNPIAGVSVLSITTNFSKVRTERVLRGGSWSQLSQYMRAADRTKGTPILSHFGVGFRCVKDISE